MTGHDPVIVAARRTIVAPRGGALRSLEPHDLAAPPIRACLDDTGMAGHHVGELVLGNALGAGGNPARLAALRAGLPDAVGGLSIDRQCCSGLDAIGLAADMVRAGAVDAVLAGGVESHSRRPLRARAHPEDGDPVFYDRPAFTPWPERDPDLAAAADRLAVGQGISREEQDAWAVRSHRLARTGQMDIEDELVMTGAGEPAFDSFTRTLSARTAARAPIVVGSISNANAAVAADGAAFCLVTSAQFARSLGIEGTRIRSSARLGGAPENPALAPVAAIRALLERARLGADALAAAEIMEAYAAQAIACLRATAIDPAIVNAAGGALARGHPIAASGAVLAVRLYRRLLAVGGSGIAAIAGAGGLGSALLLER